MGAVELGGLLAVAALACWGAWRWGRFVSYWIGTPAVLALLASLKEER